MPPPTIRTGADLEFTRLLSSRHECPHSRGEARARSSARTIRPIGSCREMDNTRPQQQQFCGTGRPDMRICAAALVAFALTVMAGAPATAQIAPGKTITIVVPAAPGGVTDTLGRQLAKTFTETWGQQVIV